MKKQTFSGLFEGRLNIFYILAFLPLPLIEIYRLAFFDDALGILTPLYGFLILLLKKDKLSDYLSKTSALQKFLGGTVVSGSFFTYYAIAPLYSSVGFYGLPNYIVYTFGLFLIFFKISAFKQGFSAFFLLVASAFVGLSFRWIEVQISPAVPYYVSLFSFMLNVFGVRNIIPHPRAILLFTPRGQLPVTFEAGCIGVFSLIIFSIILVVTMMETSTNRRTKLLWSVFGLIGVFIVNIIRLLIVIASMYFYGYDFGQSVHQVIGYPLFLSWLATFLLLFAKRQIIIGKIQLAQRKIMAWL